MKTSMYPFYYNGKKDYPEGSMIIREYVKDKISMIEYDLVKIEKVLNNQDPTDDFSDFPKLEQNQLKKLLKVVTHNIVEIKYEE
jgi:hypothetical protein